ncbi:hypothetical protein FQV30_08135 [Planomicrobium sp. CPCC 101110]|nr:hypothetical protein FQV30_08135 [Planomicrobium sp. CPCC 101110]
MNFIRADSFHSKKGNGLGLALSLKVIDLLAGRISVKNLPGSGTAFTIVLKTKKSID